MGTLREDICKFMIICRSSLLGMRNVSDSICREYRNTIFVLIIFYENSAVYDIMRKNVTRARKAKYNNIPRRMRYACWMTGCRHKLRVCNTYCFPGNNCYPNALQCNIYTYSACPFFHRGHCGHCIVTSENVTA
jgi:hypothetical protein